MGKRIYPLQRIRYWYCYDIEEICSLYKDCELHPQTVRQWIKNGLPVIDSGKPALVYGSRLTQYLGKLNQSHKCKTAFYEMFCMKCKDAKTPSQRRITLHQDNKSVKAKGRCPVCKTIMNKNYKMDDIPRLRSAFRVGYVLELYDSPDSPSNTHIHARAGTYASESAQWELFPL